MLSREQEYAYCKFTYGSNLFITGPGGSGKSYLIKKMVDYLHKKNYPFQVTSTTGCSSVLLSNNLQIGGKNVSVKTINAFSGVKLCKGENSIIINNVINNRYSCKVWRKIKVLIIDEVSMMSCKMFTILDW